ncbi:transmembrane protein 179b [Plakobranchus ocellatus]|uniref:Transmembrane protein 179b n=1 Tax=Plakobranchus ocellatus TaxID=259542 RepID=A0AAV4BD84_9GAST|nr:transmembrane protein 179b [Plakobranchus ocellatus]
MFNSKKEEPEPPAEDRPSILPDWLGERPVSIIGMVCFALLIVLCFFILVPIAISMKDADDNCFLFADSSGFGAASICEYILACAIMLLILCVIRILLLLYKVGNKRISIVSTVAGWFSLYGVHLAILFLDVILLILLLITASMISGGLYHLCNSLFGNRSECAAHDGITLPNDRVNRSFYKTLTFAEGSAWAAFLIWLLVVVYELIIGWRKGTLQPVLSKIKGGPRTSN